MLEGFFQEVVRRVVGHPPVSEGELEALGLVLVPNTSCKEDPSEVRLKGRTGVVSKIPTETTDPSACSIGNSVLRGQRGHWIVLSIGNPSPLRVPYDRKHR